MNPEKLQAILNPSVKPPYFPGMVFSIRRGKETWTGSAGNFTQEQPFFIASTTKLYVTTLVLQQISRGRLAMETPISALLPGEVWKGIHVLKGKDYSTDITLQQLMAHTSGLPDYFGDKPKGGTAWQSELTQGQDRAWTPAEAIEHSKEIPPIFAPGTAGRAHYSDTNFQLLGLLLEHLSGSTLQEQLQQEIFAPLGLQKTYLYSDPNDRRPQCLRFREKELPVWKAMASFGADGGIVSTADELRRFTDAFFHGELFPASMLDGLQQWNRIFFPMRSGIGIHLFRLPWIFNPFGTVPPMIGHSGLSGTVAYYDPKSDCSIAGTVNQIDKPGTSFRVMIRLLLAARKG